MAQSLPFRPIAGVVPCAGGWLVQPARLLAASILPEEPIVLASLIDVIDYRPTFETIALDAPIGIPDEPFGGFRQCDIEAREVLGWPRRISIHPVPCRSALHTSGFAPANAIEPWLTPLAHRRFRYVREIDDEIQSYQQRRLFSANPDLSFYLVNADTPTRSSSFWRDGPGERLRLLQDRLPGLQSIAREQPPKGATLRQVMNAAALLWTARRIAGRAISRLPADPQWDALGRRMEIVR